MTFFGENLIYFWIGFLIVIIWSAIWKGIALWKSARNNQRAWYIILLVVNTIGILEIIYLVWFQKKKKK